MAVSSLVAAALMASILLARSSSVSSGRWMRTMALVVVSIGASLRGSRFAYFVSKKNGHSILHAQVKDAGQGLHLGLGEVAGAFQLSG
jgi:hypothetical protein